MDLYKIRAHQNGLIIGVFLLKFEKFGVPSRILGGPLFSFDFVVPNFISVKVRPQFCSNRTLERSDVAKTCKNMQKQIGAIKLGPWNAAHWRSLQNWNPGMQHIAGRYKIGTLC